MSNTDVLIDGEISLSSVIGMGSKRPVVGLLDDISEQGSERLIGVRLSRRLSGLIVSYSTDEFNKLQLQLTEVRPWQILFKMSLLKKLVKS